MDLQPKNGVNVGNSERLASGVLGGVLVLMATRQRSWLAQPLALIGVSLLGRGFSGKCAVYKQLGVSSAHGGHHLALPGGMFNRTVKVQKTVTVKASPAEVYGFWRQFENLPRFTQNLISVAEKQPGMTHWVARGPNDLHLEWEARIHEDTPNERISWATTEDSPIQHNGSVSFREAPAGRGTEIKVVLRYDIPAGVMGQALAKVLGDEPGQQLDADLRRLKMYLETGEVARTDGQPAGAGRDTTGQMSTNDAILDLSIK
ncbi:MAG: SRPBCC family protein [Candidatus Eremiobacteraeota bacterium]|nr:SRPBCC family protein [Candidatus Eremiobacteraeota bacterium]